MGIGRPNTQLLLSKTILPSHNWESYLDRIEALGLGWMMKSRGRALEGADSGAKVRATFPFVRTGKWDCRVPSATFLPEEEEEEEEEDEEEAAMSSCDACFLTAARLDAPLAFSIRSQEDFADEDEALLEPEPMDCCGGSTIPADPGPPLTLPLPLSPLSPCSRSPFATLAAGLGLCRRSFSLLRGADGRELLSAATKGSGPLLRRSAVGLSGCTLMYLTERMAPAASEERGLSRSSLSSKPVLLRLSSRTCATVSKLLFTLDAPSLSRGWVSVPSCVMSCSEVVRSRSEPRTLPVG